MSMIKVSYKPSSNSMRGWISRPYVRRLGLHLKFAMFDWLW